jgi:hypothetical protein
VIININQRGKLNYNQSQWLNDWALANPSILGVINTSIMSTTSDLQS